MDLGIKDISKDIDSEELIVLATTWGMDILIAALILIAGWMIGNGLSRSILAVRRLDETLANFLAGIAKYAVFAVAVVTILGQFGVQTASLLAVLGAGALAIGLALQGTLSNVAAGVMLLFLRPFNVGDYITFGEIGGTVKNLGLFSTELATADNVYISAPNSSIWGTTLLNYNRNPFRRQDILISTSFEDDIDKTFDALSAILKADPRIVHGTDSMKTEIMVDKISTNSVDIIIRFWAKSSDYWGLRWDITKAIKEKLASEGISLAIPTRTIALNAP